MKRGRKPVPQPILKLRGSREPTAQLREDEPPPMSHVKTLECLDPLPARAAEIWKQTETYLAEMGILGQVAPKVLKRYCELQARWDALDESGESTIVMIKLAPVISRLEAAMGLTPSDRRNVSIGRRAEKADPLAALMGKSG